MKSEKKYSIKWMIIILLVIAILTITATKVWAYFTTYTVAEGTLDLTVGNAIVQLQSEKGEGREAITVKNISEVPVMVRVKLFVPAGNLITVTSNSENWKISTDGYWEYKNMLNVGETTDDLVLNSENNQKRIKCFAIAEATNARFNENNEAYANWTATIEDEE